MTQPRLELPINKARDLAASDFKWFLNAEASIRGYSVPAFHYEMADFLQGTKRQHVAKVKMIRGFRLAAKSYVVRAFCRWRQLRVPKTQVLIHSSTDDNAIAFCIAYQKELRENPLTSHLAPSVGGPEKKFNLNVVVESHGHQRLWTPEVGSGVKAAGIKSSLVGNRCDLYIFDDPEPDVNPEGYYEDIIRAMMEAKNILHSPMRHLDSLGVKELTPQEATQLVVVGQPHWSGSAYILPDEADSIEVSDGSHPLNDALILDIPAINPVTGYWLWPELMEPKHWDAKENRPQTIDEAIRGYTSEAWELGMMVNVNWMAGRGAVLKLNHLLQIRRKSIGGAVMVVDPADSLAGCEWGAAIGEAFDDLIHLFYLGGFTGEAYEGDVEDDTIGESTWAEIFDIADEFKVRLVLIEKNYKSAAAAAKRYLAKSRRQMAVDFYPASGNKLRRICNSLEQPVNNGMISVDPQILKNSKTLQQLRRLRWDKLPTPCDRIDAAAALVDYLIENRGMVSSSASAYDPIRLELASEITRRGVASRPAQSRLHR